MLTLVDIVAAPVAAAFPGARLMGRHRRHARLGPRPGRRERRLGRVGSVVAAGAAAAALVGLTGDTAGAGNVVVISAPDVRAETLGRPAVRTTQRPQARARGTRSVTPTGRRVRDNGVAPTPSSSTSSSTEPVTTPAATTPAATTPAATTPSARTTPASTTPAAATPSSTPPSGWRQVWADEFDGSTVDGSRWKAEHLSTYGDGNNELACLMDRPENIAVSGGVLHLIARREATPLACGSDSRFPGGRQFSSAHLTTRGTAEWTYGRFEVRAKLPTQAGSTKGLWPAFWLRPTAGGTGELDVLEAIGSDGSGSETSKVHQTIWYDYTGTHRREAATVTVPGVLPSAGYHVFAAEWQPGAIDWYVDGRLTYSRTGATTPWLDSAFDKPFFLRLNLAVGGDWPGSPTGDTRFPARFDVDYVRVYQR